MQTKGWWLTWPLWWQLLWGRDPDLWAQDLHRTLWEFLISLGSFLFLFPEKWKGQFGCSFNKEHSLQFCCEIYYRKKWPNPRKEKRANRLIKRELEARSLIQAPSPSRTVRVWCPLLSASCLCLCLLFVFCVPWVRCPVYPTFCQRQTSPTMVGGKSHCKMSR